MSNSPVDDGRTMDRMGMDDGRTEDGLKTDGRRTYGPRSPDDEQMKDGSHD